MWRYHGTLAVLCLLLIHVAVCLVLPRTDIGSSTAEFEKDNSEETTPLLSTNSQDPTETDGRASSSETHEDTPNIALGRQNIATLYQQAIANGKERISGSEHAISEADKFRQCSADEQPQLDQSQGASGSCWVISFYAEVERSTASWKKLVGANWMPAWSSHINFNLKSDCNGGPCQLKSSRPHFAVDVYHGYAHLPNTERSSIGIVVVDTIEETRNLGESGYENHIPQFLYSAWKLPEARISPASRAPVMIVFKTISPETFGIVGRCYEILTRKPASVPTFKNRHTFVAAEEQFAALLGTFEGSIVVDMLLRGFPGYAVSNAIAWSDASSWFASSRNQYGTSKMSLVFTIDQKAQHKKPADKKNKQDKA